jgi:hypothetical protein
MRDGLSVAEEVRMYLKNKPYILNTLEKGLINLSELSRLIQKEMKIRNIHAVKAALRRHSELLIASKQRREEKILNVLKGSRITVWDNMSLLIANKDLPIKADAKVSVNSQFIIVISKDQLKDAVKRFKQNIIRMHENCSVLLVTSPKVVQETPGVVAFQAAVLAEQNINVIEFFSCFENTIIVVDRADILRSYEILSRIVG